MLFPKISVISTQYTKTVDGVKGVLRVSFDLHLRATRKFCAPSRINQLKLSFCATLCYCFRIYLNYPLQCRQSAVDNYLASRLGKYPLLATSTSVESC